MLTHKEQKVVHMLLSAQGSRSQGSISRRYCPCLSSEWCQAWDGSFRHLLRPMGHNLSSFVGVSSPLPGGRGVASLLLPKSLEAGLYCSAVTAAYSKPAGDQAGGRCLANVPLWSLGWGGALEQNKLPTTPHPPLP